MMNKSFLWLLLVLGGGWMGCQMPTTDTTSSQEGPFFDLEAFFEQEAAYLAQAAPQLDKTIRHNDREENRLVTVEDWAAELRFFSKADINRRAWEDQYQVDTVPQKHGYQLQYIALNPTLQTQRLDIHVAADTVQSIIAIQKVDNQVYQSQRYLTYFPKQRYEIKQLQDVALLQDNDYLIQATYRYE